MPFFRNTYNTINSYKMLCLICVFALPISIIATIILLREEHKIIIMDNAGNYHLVVAYDLKNADKLRDNCARAAATALLTRNPDGFVFPDLLFQTFLRNCDEWIKNHVQQTAPEFSLQKIRQIPEVRRIKILDRGNGYWIAHMQIYLTRACEYEGTKFVDNFETVVSFLMVENPDISVNGRLPLAVVKIERFDPLRKIESGGVKK